MLQMEQNLYLFSDYKTQVFCKMMRKGDLLRLVKAFLTFPDPSLDFHWEIFEPNPIRICAITIACVSMWSKSPLGFHTS